jgi:putative CocE/NonD family hydrolase
LVVALLLVGLALFYWWQPPVNRAKVSEFGRYEGYSEAVYDGTRRISDYLSLSNGTRLAYDLILPTKKGVVADRALPVLFKYTPYLRTFTIFDESGKDIISDLYRMPWMQRAYLRLRYWTDSAGGRLIDPVFRDRWLGRMLQHGYAVIVVERPGTGASFGRLDPSFETGARETDEIINWIAVQKWSDGNVGMFGNSWQGQIQLSAASTGNRHLKAIFPVSTWLDQYTLIYPGGVYNKGFGQFFSWSQAFLDSKVVTPVDRDRDGTLLAQARAERRGAAVGETVGAIMTRASFRDSKVGGRTIWAGEYMPYAHKDRINRAGVPMYLMAGWYDIVTRDAFLLYANFNVPKRLAVRPLDHSQTDESQFDLDLAAEAHRWFDYWLKGVRNGVMDEPPIFYYLMGGDGKLGWRSTDAWPLGKQTLTRLYFGAGEPPGSGVLRPEAPMSEDAADRHAVDYTATTGKKSRWTAVNWVREYPDMRTNDAEALTFTTPPLEAAVEVIGHPLVRIWLSSDAPDLDVFAYLEEVDRDGNAKYITEGNLRVSHRSLSQAPYENFGLPFQRHSESERKSILAGEAVEVVFDLLPTAYRFSEGKRIRVTIAFADADNFDTPIVQPSPIVRLHRDRNRPSSIELPAQ